MGIDSPDTVPENFVVLAHLQQQSAAQQCHYIYSIAEVVVEKCTVVEEAITFQSVGDTGDMVYNYAKVLCHYGSLAIEFVDAWEEGDGDRILRCWKVFMLHFYSKGRVKYSWEALRLQIQLASLPQRLATQLKWNRFINTHGGLGRNIPCDLHNEHINKLFKEIINNMGANLTDESMHRAARAVTTLHQARSNFDKHSGVPMTTSAHATRPDNNDVLRVASVVCKEESLEVKQGRHHSSFNNIAMNPLSQLKKESLQTWIERKIKHVAKYTDTRGEGDESDSAASDDNN